ncbi:MAG: nicotinate (nicotinamide) nucleotide adenylyltransferase [Terracidiphilus sp.]|jgi:nicotinate-nucleotide adenylyltransferase
MNLPRQVSGLASSEIAKLSGMGMAFFGGSRIAFFGGSFDPPHLGHLAVARAARGAFRLDAVLFAPVGMQPLKPEGPAASFEDRLEMTRLAIAGEPGFEVSLADAPRSPGAPLVAAGRISAPNYTIDTLEGLRRSYAPGSTLYCLMGADAFFGLRHWHRAVELPFVAPLIVASRPGQPLEGLRDDLNSALPPGLALKRAAESDGNEAGVKVRVFDLLSESGHHAPFYVLPGLNVEISASEIRKGIGAQIQASHGGPTSEPDLVPPAVRDYIAQHELYQS